MFGSEISGWMNRGKPSPRNLPKWKLPCGNLVIEITPSPPSFHSLEMPFGEIVVGSPGSGKSTYCYGKHQLLTALNRPISIVNLDPANDNIPYPCAIDTASLITLQDVMDTYSLGPNGGMLYCMEYLDENFDWLDEKLKTLGKDAYVVFDLPGQVELSTNHESLKRIIGKLSKSGFRVRGMSVTSLVVHECLS